MSNLQERGQNLVSREVLLNANSIMQYLMEKEGFEALEIPMEDEDGDEIEIYEWYFVSDWLARKLENEGEVVLALDMLDGKVWGRQCRGQAIYMDSVIEKIVVETGFGG